VVEPVLRIRDVEKSFGGLAVLRGVSLDVPAGSITGLIGPNGSGKSTLFDIVTRYQRCDAGDVLFQGESVVDLGPHQVSRRGLVRTFQLTRIFPTLTVAENLLVFARRGGGSGVDKAVELLEFVGLLRLAGHEAAGLSYGQQKLLEIAQVLMLEPRLLMLDEPMAGINPGLAEELTERLRDLRAGGMTILLVEHNIPVIQSLCDRVAVLGAGRVMACGEPDAVLADNEVREAFLT
jgi:ABC-type branched-subunit amino acid transport system ATPase component